MPEQTQVINGRLHVIEPDGTARRIPISMDEARDMKNARFRNNVREVGDLERAAAEIEQAGQDAGAEYEA